MHKHTSVKAWMHTHKHITTNKHNNNYNIKHTHIYTTITTTNEPTYNSTSTTTTPLPNKPACSLSTRVAIRSMTPSFSPKMLMYSCMSANSAGLFFIMYEAPMLWMESVTWDIIPLPCFLWAWNSWHLDKTKTAGNQGNACYGQWNT